MYSNILERISSVALFLVIVLLPIFFIPFTNISVEVSKSLFLVVGLVITVIFWIIARFSDGKISFPRSLPLFAGAAMVLVFLLSSLLGGAPQVSLFGTMMDVGTFWFIFCSFILMLMSAMLFSDSQSARLVLIGTALSSIVVMVFQFLHLFFPKILSLGALVGQTDNILGSWNALGIFAGFYIVSSLFLIEFFSVPKLLKIILGAFIVLSLVLIAIINFAFVWEILGIFALLIFIYKLSINVGKNHSEGKINFPIFSFIIVLLSLLFFTSSGFIVGIFPPTLRIPNNEVSPSVLSTLAVAKSVLRSHPLLGMGPNRFADAWALYKPAVINTTAFWDVSFNSGLGVVPTLAATTGVLGILALVVFFLLLIVAGIKSLFSTIKNNISLETVSFFFLSIYLFISSFFYFTGTVIFLLAMVFGGIFIGLVSKSYNKGEISLSFLNDQRKSFFFMLVLVLLMIASAALGFKYIERFASVPFFTRTLAAKDVPSAETNINKALSLNKNDLYLRTYAQVYLLKLNSIAGKGGSLSESDQAALQTTLDRAVSGAQLATVYDGKNYLNFQMLGNVFQTAGLIGVKDGYEQALNAYKTSSDLNPQNPRLKLVLSNISTALERNKDAKDYANQALALKPDYVDALITLAQIYKNEGDLDKAIYYAQTALSFAPNDKNLIKYVDDLRNGSATPTPTPSAQ